MSLAREASAGPYPECETAGKVVGRLQSVSPGHGKAPVTGPLWELPACLLLDTVLLQGEGTGPTQRNKGRASLVRVDFSSFPPSHPPTVLCEFLNELNVPQEKVFLKFGKYQFDHYKLTGCYKVNCGAQSIKG